MNMASYWHTIYCLLRCDVMQPGISHHCLGGTCKLHPEVSGSSKLQNNVVCLPDCTSLHPTRLLLLLLLLVLLLLLLILMVVVVVAAVTAVAVVFLVVVVVVAVAAVVMVMSWQW